MSGIRKPDHGAGTTLTQWLVITPILVLIFAGIAFYIYVAYFSPSLMRGERTVTTEVLDRTEVRRDDGSIDAARSYLLVRVEGRDLKLRPVQPAWDSIHNGDRLEVEVGRSAADGTLVAYTYKRVGAGPSTGERPSLAAGTCSHAVTAGAPFERPGFVGSRSAVSR
jgi:hypothetical protein